MCVPRGWTGPGRVVLDLVTENISLAEERNTFLKTLDTNATIFEKSCLDCTLFYLKQGRNKVNKKSPFELNQVKEVGIYMNELAF